MNEYNRCVVHTFRLGDVDDIELYAGMHIYDWESSEEGKWVMDHAAGEIMWHRNIDPHNYQYVITITAVFSQENHTFWRLKFK